MKFRPTFKIVAILLSVILIACGSGTTTEETTVEETTVDKINVLATTPMLGDFLNEIGGANINLTILMPPEADPHTYDPSPQDAAKIAEADLVFYVGLKYEPSAVMKLIENTSNTESVLVEVGEYINPIEFSEEGHDDHDDEEGHDDHDDEEGHDDHDDEEGHEGHEGHDHGSEDPHFWFDPARVSMAVELMINKLIELDPSNEVAYKTSGDAYINELNQLDTTISKLIETIPSENRKIITTHESLGYLEAKYGLEVLSTIIPSLSSANEISPAQLAGVLDVIEDNNVQVMFIEAEAPSVYGETIAQEADIKVVTGLWVETLKENQSYTTWLLENVQLIVDNLVDLP